MINWDCNRNRSHQPYITELINTFTPNGTGVEIGVNEGQLSFYLLQNTNIQHLYLIDTWQTWKGWASQETLENRYKFCNEDLPKMFSGRVTTIRKASAESYKDVDNDLDFIFIDGNHNYDYVKQDLELWVPKVKSGGLVAGHDWSHNYVGVIEAVIEYCQEHSNKVLPYFTDYTRFNLKLKYQPAPAINPIINKSSTGKVWWMIKSN